MSSAEGNGTVTNQPPTISDEALARAAQAGALASFEELVRRYEMRIFRFVANSCRSGADAREITQEAFVSAFLHLREFDPDRSFQTWLFTIARRKCVDRHRATARVADEPVPEIVDDTNPAGIMLEREAREDLWRTARALLPAPQFQVLWLKYAEDFSVDQIARVTSRTRTHVKVLLFRARARLSLRLKREGRPNPSAKPKSIALPDLNFARTEHE